MEIINRKSIGTTIVNVVSLIILNISLVAIFGFLTVDSWANINSRIGAFVLSFFLSFFIVSKTQDMTDIERLMKFGSGFIFYLFVFSFIAGLPFVLTSGLLPSLTIALGVLYCGRKLVVKD